MNVFGCPKPQLQSGFCDVCFGLLFSQIYSDFQLWSKYPGTKKQSPFPPISSTQPQRGEMCRVVFWRLGQGPPGPSTGGFPSLVVLTRAVKFCRCNFGVSLCAAAARGWLRCFLVGCRIEFLLRALLLYCCVGPTFDEVHALVPCKSGGGVGPSLGGWGWPCCRLHKYGYPRCSQESIPWKLHLYRRPLRLKWALWICQLLVVNWLSF